MLTKIKNWLLTGLIVLGGVLDLGFGFLNEFAVELGVSPKVVTYFRLGIVLVGAIILKLQAPSTNPDKLQDLVYKAEEKKSNQ